MPLFFLWETETSGFRPTDTLDGNGKKSVTPTTLTSVQQKHTDSEN